MRNGLSRLSRLVEEDADDVLGRGTLDDQGLADEPTRQPDKLSVVSLILPAPKASTIHKSFDDMEAALAEFLSAVMVVAQGIADEAVSAEATEAEVRVSWAMEPEDVARFISLAKSVPAWVELQKLGASFEADK